MVLFVGEGVEIGEGGTQACRGWGRGTSCSRCQCGHRWLRIFGKLPAVSSQAPGRGTPPSPPPYCPEGGYCREAGGGVSACPPRPPKIPSPRDVGSA